MGMITINEIGRRWNAQYKAMSKSPAIESLHSTYVELLMHSTQLAAELELAQKENAKLRRGETVTTTPSTSTISQAAPQPASNYWATTEGQARLRQNFPGIVQPGSTASSARRSTSTAEALDYSTPEGREALLKKFGVE